MTELTDLQIKLTEQLLISVLREEPSITYGTLAGRVVPPIHHRNVGKNIGQISKLCHELGLPLLSAKVVSKNTSIAGEGFYALQQLLGIPINGKSEKELHNAELKAIRDCKEWYKLEDYLGLKIGMPRPDKHELGEFDSWNLLKEDVAVKTADKSVFEHNGSAIPKDIKWFFCCEDLEKSQSKKTTFENQGNQYSGRVMVDPYERARIFWSTELTHNIGAHYHTETDEYPLIRFQRLAPDHYRVDIIDENLIADDKEDPLETEVIPQIEGKKKELYITKYERSPANRENAIKIYGTRCMVCGFDFEAVYGEVGRSFIEVHHIKPLSDIGEEVTINPETDLVCVCSNCHRIIHRKKNGVYTLDEVRKMINEQRNK